MSDKKRTIIRLVIFLVIAFLPFWIIVPLMHNAFGGSIYMVEEAGAAVYALGVFGMMIPSVAVMITRLITKEGFKDSYLALNFKGNAHWYIAAVVVKLVEGVIVTLIIWAMFSDGLSFSEAFSFDDMPTKIGAIILQLSASIILFIPAFGEEWGWRGYMMPKLTELFGKPAAVVIGGILWGLWHAPLTVEGHNFGTDHPLHPWIGIGLMCVNCVLFNAFLTLLTERTKSIYPASFCHMVNNNFAGGALIVLFGTEAMIGRLATLDNVEVMLKIASPMYAVVAVISMILLLKGKKEKI